MEELTEAGYEAYNVTDENYTSLETTLKTDFSEMGLDPDGSYIVIISGEEDCAAAAISSRASDLLLPPHIENEGGSYFYYEYNGFQYKMRYVTVTSSGSDALYKSSSFTIHTEYWVNHILQNLFNTVVTAVVENAYDKIPFGTLASLAFDQTDNYTYIELEELIVSGPFMIALQTDPYRLWELHTTIPPIRVYITMKTHGNNTLSKLMIVTHFLLIL